MPGKGSKQRYREMLADVQLRASYAFSIDSVANPYPVDDKRHARFAKALEHIHSIDSDFRDMCEVHGCDAIRLRKKVHPNPGPVTALA